MAGTSEGEIALAILRIAATKSDLIATFEAIRAELPTIVPLDPHDLSPSPTRGGEPLWHQIVRNIQSHHKSEGNYIYEGRLEHVPDTGYRATAEGIQYLQSIGIS